MGLNSRVKFWRLFCHLLAEGPDALLKSRKVGSNTSRMGSIEEVRAHYDRLLEERYLWAYSDINEGTQSAAAMLDRLSILATSSRTALDLGCGPGYFSLALSQRGFRVTAIDLSERFLADIRRLDASVRTVCAGGHSDS
jgi:2-polyprenyl-3-methyl-5-hydroxy-6-metoxy-1,4-benzoquinol methylase